ncbi:vWA domain-containing protein [Taibaiella chishuiensis]|uniref:von Willebrand factor type A domain-containing protein n=1 Tax=Taibaiella chishuiensis TaxID=1434707 RepID=A0A2P8DDD3_9BACT|nr:vWA domain-containing protein [Taibaiella chishuiensis]PSK95228.1 von Willebrand factor type A domain-containing protein [Taibaiella chishuiensis]
MSNQGLKYNVDLVFCIDVTGSMHGILETVKSNALKMYPDLQRALEEKDKNVEALRIKVIAYRDFYADGSDAVLSTEFIDIKNDAGKFESFVRTLRPEGGGDEPENGLEALALAMRSDWVREGDRQRHIIVVWSDASTHPLEKSRHGAGENYPEGMPADFNELTDWWDGQTYMSNRSAKRLVIFAPDCNAWTDIATHWENTVHYPSKAGQGLADVDYKTIMSAIINSI